MIQKETAQTAFSFYYELTEWCDKKQQWFFTHDSQDLRGGHNYQTDTKFKKGTNHYSQLWLKNEIRENTSGVNINSL